MNNESNSQQEFEEIMSTLEEFEYSELSRLCIGPDDMVGGTTVAN